MDPVIHHTLRVAVSALFLVACVHKLRAFGEFRRALADHDVVPAAFVPAAAAMVVVVEMAAVVSTAAAASGLAGILLLAYAGVIALNIVRGRERIDCGCVGVAGRDGLSWWLVGRNLVCAAAAFAVLVPTSDRATAWLDWFSVVAATVLVAACWVAADGLIANAGAYRRLREAT